MLFLRYWPAFLYNFYMVGANLVYGLRQTNIKAQERGIKMGDYILGGIVAVLLLGYLIYVLLKPEEF